MPPPQLSLYDLYNLKKKKDLNKNLIFDKILEKCHDKIKTIAKNGGTNIFYEIPYYMLGYPLYDINICIEYVTTSLKKNGLFIQIMPKPNNNVIYISWNPVDLSNNIKKKLLE